MRHKTILAIVALLAGTLGSQAAVTVQGWWHLDNSQPIADSSGNNRTFGSAYSTAPAAGGQFAAQAIQNGAGGPLDGGTYSSANCIMVGVGVGNKRQSAMWGIGYNPPASNFGIEIWVLPQDNGIAGGSGGWIFSSGQNGGVALRINAPGGTDSYIDAVLLGTQGPLTVGAQVPIDTNKWMHLAIVNAGGITTFYTNGVPCGDSDTNNAIASAGDAYIGTPSDNQAYFGYLDEARMFTFAAGSFTTNDLLLRPPGPNLIQPPQNAIVWSGGAAPFKVVPSFDNTLSFQWRRGGTALAGATGMSYALPQVSAADSGSTFDTIVTGDGLSVTSSVATLTVVSPTPADINAYRTVTAADSPIAYFPVDQNLGTTLSNIVDATANGVLDGNATYDGRTNRAFGERALSFDADGDVSLPIKPAYDFSGGNGTIEALVFMNHATVNNQSIFSVAGDPSTVRYQVGANGAGNTLLFFNGTDLLSWPVSPGLIGKLSHVVFVIDHGVNVTAYVDGTALGTKQQSGLGSSTGQPAWIGSGGFGSSELWAGTIDELAIYGTALSQNAIQTHYTKLVYGANVAPPAVVTQPTGTKTLLAGASPILTVTASGALPISYQWTSNGVPISGANSSSFTLAQTTTNSTASYGVVMNNVFGSTTSAPIALTFVTPPAGYAAKVMADGPSSFWRLAETSGTNAVDSAGLNDGKYSGGVTFGVGGLPGDSTAGVRFDGSSGVVQIPNSPTLNPTTPFSVEFWTKLDAPGFYVPVGSINRPSRDSGWEFYVQGNYPGFEFHTSPGGYSMITGDNTADAAGVWYHVVGIYANEGGTNFLRLYVNGQHASPDFQDSWPPDGPYVPNAAQALYIGARTDNTHYLKGIIGDVAFYQYALSEAQIQNHLLVGAPVSISMNPASNLIADSKPTGTAHNGVNHGATWTDSNNDGATTRQGVMGFVATNANQITVAANPAFSGATSGTIMFWMRSAGTITSTGTSGNPGDGAMLFDYRNTASGFVIVQAEVGNIFVQSVGSAFASMSTTASVSDNKWHHVAVTYGQTDTDSVYVYVDGTLDNSSVNSTAWAWPATQELELGTSHDSYWQRYNGALDDVRFYNRILSDSEIAQAKGGALVDANALAFRYNFDTAPVTGYALNLSPQFATLQSAAVVTGPYQDVTNAPTPYLVVPSGTMQFYRAKTQQ